MFRFPPLVRALYELIQQRMILAEHRSVLANYLLGYYQKHHEPNGLFEAQFTQMIFVLFYDQMSATKPQDPEAPKRFLEAFSIENLACAGSKKKLNDAIAIPPP